MFRTGPALWLFSALSFVALLTASGTTNDAVPPRTQGSFRETAFPGVFILTGDPQQTSPRDFSGTRHCLIMVPGISSGDLDEQGLLLSQIGKRSGADTAVFLDWGYLDPTRKVVSPLATAKAAEDLAALCQRIDAESPAPVAFDILAHSAGTVVVNKAAVLSRDAGRAVRFRHVLFLGTPHDPNVDLSAIKASSRALLNLYSDYDKISRTISGAQGKLGALTGQPYWNLRLDTSLGGRRIRHYAFLENTPENWTPYAHFFATGTWLTPREADESITLAPAELYRLAAGIRENKAAAEQRAKASELAEQCLANADPEIRYYGALLLGLMGDPSAVPLLKTALETPSAPAYLRREVYQALGNIADPQELRYLQRARESDPDSGDVLRDVLRDWKRKRIRPR